MFTCLKGVKPPVEFGERTQDCSPGDAGCIVLMFDLAAAARSESLSWNRACTETHIYTQRNTYIMRETHTENLIH